MIVGLQRLTAKHVLHDVVCIEVIAFEASLRAHEYLFGVLLGLIEQHGFKAALNCSPWRFNDRSERPA